MKRYDKEFKGKDEEKGKRGKDLKENEGDYFLS
jgi:hypothetical protein